MKLQQDMRKKRQEVLEKQIECQKVRQELNICLLELMYRMDLSKVSLMVKFLRGFYIKFY